MRIGYVATQAITLLVYYYAASKIRAKKDMTTLKYGESRVYLVLCLFSRAHYV